MYSLKWRHCDEGALVSIFFFANYVKRDIDSRGGQDGDHIKSFSSLLLFFSFPPYPTRSLLEPWEREGSHTVLPRLTCSLSCSAATTTRSPRSTSWEALSVWWSCFRRSCSLEFPSSSRTCTMLTCLRRTSYLPGPRRYGGVVHFCLHTWGVIQSSLISFQSYGED